MTPKPSEDSIRELNALVSSVAALLTQLEATLTGLSKQTKSASSPSSKRPPSNIESLKVATDSASLIKAHTTKLSLLIITEPFTPSAICKVLRELVSGPVPALAAAAEACDPARYTADFSHTLIIRCHGLLGNLRTFIMKIPSDGKVVPAEEQQASTDGSGKGSMPMTGILWASCDQIVAFCKEGVSGYYVKKVEETRLTLKDIMEELKEWGEEEEDDGDDFADEAARADYDSAVDVNDSAANGPATEAGAAQAVLDSLMNSASTIPRDDPDGIRDRLDTCVRRLRLSTILCQAVTKRRLKVAPAFPTDDPSVVQTLEKSIGELKRLPEHFEDATAAFYDLDAAGIDSSMDVCVKEAVGIAKMLDKSWAGEKDEFTEWGEKFEVQMNK